MMNTGVDFLRNNTEDGTLMFFSDKYVETSYTSMGLTDKKQ